MDAGIDKHLKGIDDKHDGIYQSMFIGAFIGKKFEILFWWDPNHYVRRTVQFVVI